MSDGKVICDHTGIYVIDPPPYSTANKSVSVEGKEADNAGK